MIHQGIAQQVLWQEKPLSEFNVGRTSQSFAKALKDHGEQED
jgi:hypothetical protein